jgi:hypothetical protein
MCNSFEISLQTFIMSGISSVLLWTKKEYFASIFLFVVSLMQLSDALIWKNYNNPKINTLISKYSIPFILSIQMISLYVCYTKLTSTRELWYEVLLSIFIIVLYSAWITRCQQPTKIDVTSFFIWCDLVIEHWTRFIYLFFILYPIWKVYKNNNPIKWILICGVTLTFVLNYWEYSFGARWCHTSNILALILVTYVFFLRR